MKNGAEFTVVGVGELLWDILPSGEQLGGAPANFTCMTALLGDSGIIASRIGDDALGHKALERLKRLGVTVSSVQLDETHPTGTVKVELDENGQPTYIIVEDAAWDHFELTSSWQELAKRADAVCFGSLAQRSPQSRDTIRQFLQAVRTDTLVVFDVNLRRPFYSPEMLSESLKLSNMAKLNEEELPIVMRLLDLDSGGDEECMRCLLEFYELQAVCVTRGARGSKLITDAGIVAHHGFKIDVADTVGAGDAFTAALAHHHLRRASPKKISDAANRLGAWVASQVGATPEALQSVLGEVVG